MRREKLHVGVIIRRTTAMILFPFLMGERLIIHINMLCRCTLMHNICSVCVIYKY